MNIQKTASEWFFWYGRTSMPDGSYAWCVTWKVLKN